MTSTTPEVASSPDTESASNANSTDQLVKAKEIIKHNVAWSAGAGMLPVPGLDFVAITGVQLKMVNELCGAYNIPFKKALARPIIVSLIGSLGATMLAPLVATTSLKLIPGFGLLFSGTALAATSAAITYGVGQLFMDHFQNGGTLENFNLIAGRGVFKKKVKDVIHETAEKVEAASA
jgi:uncharacterized protein (DUF697 family)